MEVLDLLDKLGISYDFLEHDAVFTILDAQFIKESMNGTSVKNLFLKGSNGMFYVLLLPDFKNANFKSIRKFLGVSSLSFGSEEDLKDILGLVRGSVSPFGIINDKNNNVVILIDKDLVYERLLFHPNVNTSTISLDYKDLIKFIEFLNHSFVII